MWKETRKILPKKSSSQTHHKMVSPQNGYTRGGPPTPPSDATDYDACLSLSQHFVENSTFYIKIVMSQ